MGIDYRLVCPVVVRSGCCIQSLTAGSKDAAETWAVLVKLARRSYVEMFGGRIVSKVMKPPPMGLCLSSCRRREPLAMAHGGGWQPCFGGIAPTYDVSVAGVDEKAHHHSRP